MIGHVQLAVAVLLLNLAVGTDNKNALEKLVVVAASVKEGLAFVQGSAETCLDPMIVRLALVV